MPAASIKTDNSPPKLTGGNHKKGHGAKAPCPSNPEIERSIRHLRYLKELTKSTNFLIVSTPHWAKKEVQNRQFVTLGQSILTVILSVFLSKILKSVSNGILLVGVNLNLFPSGSKTM